MENKKIKNATPNTYKGIKFRSKLESSIAKLLDDFQVEYKYEEVKFILVPSFKYNTETVRQITYTPDFMIGNLILECKGFPSDSWKIKRKLFLNYLVNSKKDYIFAEIKSYNELLNLICMEERFTTFNILVTKDDGSVVGEFSTVAEAVQMLNLNPKSKGNIVACLLGQRPRAFGYKWSRVNREVIPLEGEIWKDAVGFEGLYKVSNLGRVASTQFHGVYRFKLLAQSNGKGYKFVKLRNWKQQIAGSYAVHRLVAQAFIPNPENKEAVDHLDTNPSNNHVDNLRWVTNTENMQNPITNQRVRESMIMLNKNKVGPLASAITKRRPVVRTHEDGSEEHYDSLKSAASAYGVYPSAINKWINKNKNGWKYKEL